MSSPEKKKDGNSSNVARASDGMTNISHVVRSQETISGIATRNVIDSGNSFGMERFTSGNNYREELKSPDPDSFADISEISANHSLNHGATTENFSSDGIEDLGISSEDNDKHLTLRFSIPIPQAGPRPTSSIHGSTYSTPGTFSISSRGCTSTAPSTAPSTCSLNESESSINEKGAVGSLGSGTGQKGKTTNQTTSLSSAQGKQSALAHTDAGNTALIASMTANASPPSSNNNNDDNVDRIDSALLSALCDPREKYGLLRLEQTLIDFMNERTTGYIEVGGPNNSIVIGGQTGGRLANGSANICNNGQTGPANVGESEGRVGKQTSFQRLCLHRLADRFNIVRESASNGSPGQVGIPSTVTSTPAEENRSAGPGIPIGSISTVPGLIRLVKVKNSRIPKNLLIDLNVSSYQRPDSSSGSPRNGDLGVASREKSSDLKELTDFFASTCIDNKSSVTFVKRQNNQPRKKMMIMKRSNGSNGSLRSNNSNDTKVTGKKNRNNLRGKKLSDKEKAYAEARARIFNECSSDNGEVHEKPNAETTGADANINAAFNPKLMSASPSSSAAPSEIEEEPDPFSRIATIQNNITYETGEGEYEHNPNYNSQQAVSSSKHAAASKVTWRNRRQEENDPDFWRGFNRNVSMHTQYPFVSTTSGQPYVNNGATNVQNTSYTHHGMMPQHYHNPQVFYPSGSHARNPYKTNTNSNGGHVSHGMNHQQSQQSSKYYGNHNQASGYYSQQQQSQHHSMRQNFHSMNSGAGNAYASSSNVHVGMYNNSEGGGPSSNTSAGRRNGNILYNMEEFPALR